MYGDFSRDSFDPAKNFTGVLMQQGRLIVDSDWNEQSAILQRDVRAFIADIIGWHGGPNVAPGTLNQYDTATPENNKGALLIALTSEKQKVSVGGGRYYADGILIQLPKKENYQTLELNRASEFKNRIVFADAWERQVCAALDSDLLDPALAGVDTCGRIKLEVRFKVLFTDIDDVAKVAKDDLGFRATKVVKTPGETSPATLDLRNLEEDAPLPHLTAWTNRDRDDKQDCDDELGSGYSGLENQLYRVEVHHAGSDGKTFWKGKDDPEQMAAAFSLKWSRDNGSVAYAAKMGNKTATLLTKWRDESRAIKTGDWIELVKQPNETGALVSVKSVSDENATLAIAFEGEVGPNLKPSDLILVRRWDHRSRKKFPVSKTGGFVVEQEPADTDAFKEPVRKLEIKADDLGPSIAIPLEDNIVVRLSLPNGSVLRAGDYWLIPARANLGDIIWPQNAFDVDGHLAPVPVPAKYVQHHYAPIAFINGQNVVYDLRRNIAPIAKAL